MTVLYRWPEQNISTVGKLTITVLVVASLLYGCISCGIDVTSPGLTIIEEELVTTEQSAKVVGLAKNTTSERLDWPLVVVTMYDDEGDVVHQWADRIEALAPNETWRFEVKYLKGPAADYEILFDHPLHFG